MKLTTAMLAAAIFIACPTAAQAQPSPKCKELLDWLSKGLLQTQQWRADDIEEGDQELTATMDVVRLQLWIAEVVSYHSLWRNNTRSCNVAT